jgi:hypothetical protein
MRLSERLDYPAAPDAVYAMLIDKAFREDVCQATGALSWSVEVDTAGPERGAGASVTIRRVMPSDVPDIVKRLVGETLEVVQTEQWEPGDDGPGRRAEVLVEIVGQPAKMIGLTTVEAHGGDGTVFAVDGDVTVSIPLFGGRLEKEVARAIRSALAVEHRRGRAYLTGGPAADTAAGPGE